MIRRKKMLSDGSLIYSKEANASCATCPSYLRRLGFIVPIDDFEPCDRFVHRNEPKAAFSMAQHHSSFHCPIPTIDSDEKGRHIVRTNFCKRKGASKVSATNRTRRDQQPYRKHESDYYITPKWAIRSFLDEWDNDTGIITNLAQKDQPLILDPCAGGDPKHGMSYPDVLAEYDLYPLTVDVRPDSRATFTADYLGLDVKAYFDLVISNPPYVVAIDFIEKALRDCKEGGYVAMLLRLNFFGSQKRAPWFKANYPRWCYVHSKRLGFFPEEPSRTDATEYMHAVWQKGYHPDHTEMRVVPPPPKK